MRILLCVLSLFVMLGCSQMAESEMPASAGKADATNVGSTTSNKSSDDKPASADTERMLIRSGSMSLEVSDVHEAGKQIQSLATAAGGYVGSVKQSSYNDRLRYDVVVRMPGNRLDEFVARIEGLATKVDSKNISVQDVSEEYVDLESRLAAKRQVEARFLELVKQAKSIEEVLRVEKEIGTVRSAIETIQGRLKYLGSNVSLSTLEVSYYEHTSTIEPGPGSKFIASFMTGWNALVRLLIGVTATWPLLIISSVAGWIYLRRRRRDPKPITQS